MSKELQASKVGWKKLRKLAITTTIIAGIGAATAYIFGGSVVFLNADGLVTSRSVAIAAPWQDARIREVYVRPGGWVAAGQKIAIVESGAMLRSLTDLAGEKARMSSRLAQLEARKTVVKTILPLAEANSAQAESFLGTIEKAGANGLAVSKTLQEMTTARMQASEPFLSLKAEQASLEVEIEANRKAFNQVSSAYDDLQRSYGDGVLHAPASGLIGSNVAMVGEVLSAGKDKVASIYTGAHFVLAYIPETDLLDLEKGQKVRQSVDGHIEKVLPVTEALPPEFQLPNRVRGRGQLVRIELPEKNNFAIDQKVQVTTCYLKCKVSVPAIANLGLSQACVSPEGSESWPNSSMALSKPRRMEGCLLRLSPRSRPRTPPRDDREVARGSILRGFEPINLLPDSRIRAGVATSSNSFGSTKSSAPYLERENWVELIQIKQQQGAPITIQRPWCIISRSEELARIARQQSTWVMNWIATRWDC